MGPFFSSISRKRRVEMICCATLAAIDWILWKTLVALDRGTVQEKRIIEIAKRYNNAVCCIDYTGVGDVVVEALQGAGVRCDPYKIGGSTAKQQLIEKLRIGFENERLSFPFDPTGRKTPHMATAIKELEQYEYLIGKTGIVRYSAPSGRHDDCVIAMALANWVADSDPWTYRHFQRRGV